MIISKKKFEEAIKEAEERVCKRYDDERCRFENERYNNERINRLEHQIYELEEKIRELKGIKDSYDKVCEAVKSVPTRGW